MNEIHPLLGQLLNKSGQAFSLYEDSMRPGFCIPHTENLSMMMPNRHCRSILQVMRNQKHEKYDASGLSPLPTEFVNERPFVVYVSSMTEDSAAASSLSQAASDHSEEVTETGSHLPPLSHPRKRKGKRSRRPPNDALTEGNDDKASQAIPTPRLATLEVADKQQLIQRKAQARMAAAMEQQNRLKLQKEQRQKALIEEKRKDDRRYQRLKAQKQRKLERDFRKRCKSYGIFRHPALFNFNPNEDGGPSRP
jgi:hypothetical protein